MRIWSSGSQVIRMGGNLSESCPRFCLDAIDECLAIFTLSTRVEGGYPRVLVELAAVRALNLAFALVLLLARYENGNSKSES